MPVFPSSPSQPPTPSGSPSSPQSGSDPAVFVDLLLTAAREFHVCQGEDPGIIELTATETNVMRFLDSHPGATPSEAAAATGLRRSNLSAALRALEHKGLVERAGDDRDRRSVRLHPTPLAQTNLARLHALWRRALEEALEGDRSGLDEAVDLLARLEAGRARARTRSAGAP